MKYGLHSSQARKKYKIKDTISSIMELQVIRGDVEKFVRAMDTEVYMNWAGLKDEMNTAAIFEKYGRIFESDVLASIKKMMSDSPDEESRKFRYLEHVLTSGHMEQEVKDLTDKKNTLESKLNVEVRGEKIPYRLASVKMVNEDDRELRNDIYRARNDAVDEINVILEKRMNKLHEISRSLGYDNYAHMFSTIKKMDIDWLDRELDVLISATDNIYREKLGGLLDGIGVKLEDAEKHDISYILRAKTFDKHFKKENAVPTLKKTLIGMGIDLANQKNVVLDDEERPKKSPRAFCAPLEVPDRVMLVVMPMGGPGDYDTLFHEAGHAEHYANVRRDEEMEYKYLGDNSVTESYAFLLQYLNINEAWLKNNIGLSHDILAEYQDFGYTKKLFFLRRYAAKLKYELELHRKGLEGMDDAYKRTLESVLGFKHPGNNYLVDLDDGIYTAQYLRAWLFEAQLRHDMEDKHGHDWFLKKSAGDELKSLWAHGQEYDVRELAGQMGYELGSRELTDDLKANLS
jgi:hypothetical protein